MEPLQGEAVEDVSLQLHELVSILEMTNKSSHDSPEFRCGEGDVVDPT